MSARTQAARATRKQVVDATRKVKKQVYLTPEAERRLEIHAMMAGKDQSRFVEDLINAHCRRYVIADRGGPELADPVPVAA